MLSSLKKELAIAFAVAVVAILALGLSQYHMARRLSENDQWVSHTQDVLRDLAMVRGTLNRADGSAQTYVITGDREYLTPYGQSIANMQQRMSELRTLTADNPNQQHRLDTLQSQVRLSLQAFQEEITARESGHTSPATMLRIESSIRKSNNDVRISLADMEGEERDLLRQRNRDARQSNHATSLLILAGTLVAIACLATAGVALYIEVEQRANAERSTTEAQAELRRANEKLAKEVSEKTRVQLRLQNSERSLRQLSLRLLKTQDEERRRIGRELHDSVGQYLSALKLELDVLASTVGEKDQTRLREKLAECVDMADQSIKEVRTMSYLLHPPMLEEVGLRPAIPWYVEGFSKRSGLQTTVLLPPDFCRLPAEVEMALFRVLQESLANVHRHSGSATAEVRLSKTDDKVILEIEDRGVGIPSGTEVELGSEIPESLGVGLQGMNERMRQLGGKLEVSSRSRGTTVRATVPCAERAPLETASA